MFALPLKCPYDSVTFLLFTLFEILVDEIFIELVSTLNSFFPGTAASLGDSPRIFLEACLSVNSAFIYMPFSQMPHQWKILKKCPVGNKEFFSR